MILLVKGRLLCTAHPLFPTFWILIFSSHVHLLSLEREYLATFKKTVAMHEVFLCKLAAHPKLRIDDNFKVFLEYKQEVLINNPVLFIIRTIYPEVHWSTWGINIVHTTLQESNTVETCHWFIFSWVYEEKTRRRSLEVSSKVLQKESMRFYFQVRR